MKVAVCSEGGWRLTPLCIKTFYAKRGIDCYCYKREKAGEKSYKYTADTYDKNLYYYSEDFGDEVDWDTIIRCNTKLADINLDWRYNQAFISTLMELGDAAFADGTTIRLVDIPDGAEYEVEEGKTWDDEKNEYYYEEIYIKTYL